MIEKFRTSTGLFEVLIDKFKPQYNETILSSQHCKLTPEQNKNAEKWMGCLKIKAKKWSYKEKTRLKEQYINGINDGDMMTNIIS